MVLLGGVTMVFERIITIEPAFDKRSPNPRKNYGIGSATLRFVLKGDNGATQFVAFTGWHLPDVTEDWKAKEWEIMGKLTGADVGYHSPKPIYDGQEVSTEGCEYLNGKPCYYDGSGLRAEEVGVPTLLNKGSEGVWEMLEEEYHRYFGSDTPTDTPQPAPQSPTRGFQASEEAQIPAGTSESPITVNLNLSGGE